MVADGRDVRIVREEEEYLLSEGRGFYDLCIGKRDGKDWPRARYNLSLEQFERLANTAVVNLEAELGKINPEMTDRLKGYKVNWEDLSMFLGSASIDEEDRGKELRERAEFSAGSGVIPPKTGEGDYRGGVIIEGEESERTYP